jgi:hypothetical protein
MAPAEMAERASVSINLDQVEQSSEQFVATVGNQFKLRREVFEKINCPRRVWVRDAQLGRSQMCIDF